MAPEILEAVGLNKTQAKAYLCLIENGALTPAELAEKTKEKRTNAYMILDQLADYGLAEKLTDTKKSKYEATNPTNLEKISSDRRQALIEAESKVKQAMPSLLSYYYSFTEKPGIRFFSGADSIKEIYRDILRTKQTLYLIRGKKLETERIVGEDFIQKFISKRVALGINVVALTPNSPESNHDPAQDKKWLLQRTWLSTDLYNEPVEINIYGTRVAFISFGEEVFGTILESPQIAEAMRKLCSIIQLTNNTKSQA